MIRPVLSALSPAGRAGRLTTLIFHRVVPQPDPLFPDEVCAQRFDQICRWLASDFHVLPLPDAVRALRDGSLPARALAITFDDGYADNHDVALPILQRHGLSATFFVATGFLDGGRMWNDTVVEAVRHTPRDTLDLGDAGLLGVNTLAVASVADKRAAIRSILAAAKYLEPTQRLDAVARVARVASTRLPDDLMMRSAQVSALHAAGMTIGGHTVTHPILAVLGDDAARSEIDRGRQVLQSLTQAPVQVFAYPNGRPGEDYSAANVEQVRALRFDAAVSTAWGAARHGTDPFQIPRFTPWDRTRLRFSARLAANLLRRAA